MNWLFYVRGIKSDALAADRTFMCFAKRTSRLTYEHIASSKDTQHSQKWWCYYFICKFTDMTKCLCDASTVLFPFVLHKHAFVQFEYVHEDVAEMSYTVARN